MTSGIGAGMTVQLRPLISSALAGAASGARSFTGLAALTLATRGDAGSQPDRTLGRPWAKAVAGLAAATEIGLDKLPNAPSRLAPPGLGSRLAGAAASGVVIARRAPGDDSLAGFPDLDGAAAPGTAAKPDAPASAAQLAACVVVSTGTALATAWLGSRWRAWAAPRLGHDWIGAVIEDAAAVTLATVAARQSARQTVV
jgi:uncharacterized membrane protein